MKLGGKEIPQPRQNVVVDFVEIGRSQRAITGRLVKDIVAIKQVFTLNYFGLDPDSAKIFLDGYKAGKPLEFEYEDYSGNHKTTVYITTIPRELYSYKPRYTANIAITMEEV